ncbi:hypothetical protein OM416_07810 [Paenibacillus sp. LS1]|uniref:hypothetical protein n=1 Tax=Paenibacillus sp. LS1 TaxID=2992120 RepID=UPI00223124B7|nr:hypothetical protein [Paenibacillus sp. LS1]MCW3791481.1 hypothetical protein [Paenibacillus sp. LS1]
MENILSTIVFILPGFMMYFWVQMMGINPVVKHTVPEFTAMAAIAWIPVSVLTIVLMNLFASPVYTIEALYEKSKNLYYLVRFTGISVVVSFILSLLYAKFGYSSQVWIINKIRISVKKTELSKSPSVWEEVFFSNDTLVVGISKYGNSSPEVYGCIDRVSRPFESKRAMRLIYMDYVQKIVERYEVPVKEVYTDVDAGVHIYIYDLEEYNKADIEERKKPEYYQTPSRSSRTTS